MIYWIILLLLFLLYPISKKKLVLGSLQKDNYLEGKKVYVILIALILVFFVGLRSVDVGMDTAVYKKIFDWATEYSSFYEGYTSWQSGGVEPLFYFITFYFAHHFSFQWYLLFLAVVSILPIIYIIWKYSNNIYFSVFLYIAFGYFSFALSGLRQAAAIGICMIAFDAAVQKNIIKYIISMIIAVLFHKTALLFIPVYFLINIKKGKYVFFVFITLLLSMFAVRSSIFVFLNRFARESFSIASTDQGGYRMFLVMVFTVVIGWVYYYKFIKGKTQLENDLSWLLLIMISISVLMWPVANLNAELNRMYYYYHIFIILYIPNLLESIKGKERIILLLIFVVVGCYSLQIYTIGGQLKYYPYIPFWK